jgi:hypothetical protein
MEVPGVYDLVLRIDLRARVIVASMALMAVLFFSGCSSPGEVRLISPDLPASFEFKGRQDLDWIWFEGPFQAEPTSPNPPPAAGDPMDIIVWKIRPPGRHFVPLNDVPTITYGQLPLHWEQEIPDRSPPRPLTEGFVYYVAGVTNLGRSLKMCILVRGGKAEPYEDSTGRNQLCHGD